MEWCSCINKSINDAVLYIVTSNYTEAFSLLWLTALTLIGFQESPVLIRSLQMIVWFLVMLFAILQVQTYIQRVYFYIVYSLMLLDPILGVSLID